MPWRISLWRFTCKPDKRQPVPGLQDLPYGLTLAPEVIVLKTLTPCRILRLQTEVLMTTATSSHLRLGNWRELYTAALFETDRTRLPERIADAEQAIVARARQLFSAGNDTIEEDQALDDAMYALRALQSCLQMQAATA
jgi:hypothetical protein